MSRDTDVQGFRMRHQVESIGILSSINRTQATWFCSACAGIDQLVGWRDGAIVARECLYCQALDTRQLDIFSPPDEGHHHHNPEAQPCT
jgi:Zn ribbon nucleic-acid-binding protein